MCMIEFVLFKNLILKIYIEHLVFSLKTMIVKQKEMNTVKILVKMRQKNHQNLNLNLTLCFIKHSKGKHVR